MKHIILLVVVSLGLIQKSFEMDTDYDYEASIINPRDDFLIDTIDSDQEDQTCYLHLQYTDADGYPKALEFIWRTGKTRTRYPKLRWLIASGHFVNGVIAYGNCCWTVYADTQFRGGHKKIKPGYPWMPRRRTQPKSLKKVEC